MDLVEEAQSLLLCACTGEKLCCTLCVSGLINSVLSWFQRYLFGSAVTRLSARFHPPWQCGSFYFWSNSKTWWDEMEISFISYKLVGNSGSLVGNPFTTGCLSGLKHGITQHREVSCRLLLSVQWSQSYLLLTVHLKSDVIRHWSWYVYREWNQ